MKNQTIKILQDLKHLNEYHYIEVEGTKEKRLIFEQSDAIYNIFSKVGDEDSLNPFDDYSYIWLNDFLSDFIYSVTNENDDINDIIKNFENNLYEYIDNKVSIYNHDLLKWLSSNINNAWYVEEALNEYGYSKERGFIGLLQSGQYKRIEAYYYNFLDSLKTYLNNKWDLEIE